MDNSRVILGKLTALDFQVSYKKMDIVEPVTVAETKESTLRQLTHCTDEETETQRRQVTCPGWPGKARARISI